MPSHVSRHRTNHSRTRRAFTLVELILTLLVVTCLVGLTMRAYNEADRLALGLQSPRVLTFEQKALLRRTLREQAGLDDAHQQQALVPNIVQTTAGADAAAHPNARQSTLP